jgi:hypothetical protein
MANKPMRPCRGCGKASVGPFCEECQKSQPKTHPANSYAVKSQKAFFKEYHSKRWQDLRALLLRSNPVCQLIEEGKQCNQPSKYCHHLISPLADSGLLFKWQNLVMLCAHHHDNREGEQENDPRNFADTIVSIMGMQQRQVHPKKSRASLSADLAGLPTFQ